MSALNVVSVQHDAIKLRTVLIHLVNFFEEAVPHFDHTAWATLTSRYNAEGRCFTEVKKQNNTRQTNV